MERSEFMERSDEEALRRLEEELRRDVRKRKIILCEQCGKALDPGKGEVFVFRGIELCSQCHLVYRVKVEREFKE